MELGQPAPDFCLPDLTGRTHCLAGYRGRIAVINFWSAECPWAERADRDLLACLRDWDGEVALLTLAANAHETDAACVAAARTRGLPLVLRAGIEVLDAYAALTTPHLFVVDGDGLLCYRGALDDVTFRQRTPRRSYLREAVGALRAGRLPDPAETPPYGCSISRFMLE